MVAERLAKVRGRIEAAARRSGRPSSEVTLVAVSKARSVAEIATAYEAGQRDFGENRADELVKKSPLLPADIRWHFVGTLQSRKAGSVEPFTYLLHSMDRTSLAPPLGGRLEQSAAMFVTDQHRVGTSETRRVTRRRVGRPSRIPRVRYRTDWLDGYSTGSWKPGGGETLFHTFGGPARSSGRPQYEPDGTLDGHDGRLRDCHRGGCHRRTRGKGYLWVTVQLAIRAFGD